MAIRAPDGATKSFVKIFRFRNTICIAQISTVKGFYIAHFSCLKFQPANIYYSKSIFAKVTFNLQLSQTPLNKWDLTKLNAFQLDYMQIN